MTRWFVCLCLVLVGCTQAVPAPAPSAPTPAAATAPLPKAAAGQSEPVPATTPNPARPGVATVSAAATRAAQPGETQPLSVVEWWLWAYRGGRGTEALQPLAPAYADQLRLSGGVKRALGVDADAIREVKLRQLPGATPDEAKVEAVLTLTEGEVVLAVTLTRTPQGWRVSRVETTG